MPEDRADHLAWCKQRALDFLERGELENAVVSMSSDLKKHPELAGISDAMLMVATIHLVNHDHQAVRRWIEGFR